MEILSAKQQRRALRLLIDVPPDVNCPKCHHSFEIAVSRRVLTQHRWKRFFFRFYRCKVCEHRFRKLNSSSILHLMATSLVACMSLILLFLLRVSNLH